MKIAVGSEVSWKWLGRNIRGIVLEIFKTPVSKVIKGKAIKRNGTAENPAYLVRSEAGNLALKLKTELQASGANKKVRKKSMPKIFE